MISRSEDRRETAYERDGDSERFRLTWIQNVTNKPEGRESGAVDSAFNSKNFPCCLKKGGGEAAQLK